MAERTFVMVKPDGVRRRLTGEIIRRFEARGLKPVAIRMQTVSRDLAETHYAVHREKPFFGELVEFITSGPVVAMVWEGENVIQLVRNMVGATRPLDALSGTIRGDFTCSLVENIVHASDAPQTADAEITLWFGAGGLVE